uniref:Fibroblast growth factor 1a n=1 Tax=Scophthalmus maximus TaxID=52904 RepID=A0A8D2ZUX4_SCOMX
MADDGEDHHRTAERGPPPLRDHRRRTRLYCMNGGHHLQILPDGTVRGRREDGDVHSKTILSIIKPTVSDESYFLEKLEENHYNTYRPQKYLERKWYVALKKSGKPKVGPRTHIGQKAVFFLPPSIQ